MNDKCDLGKHYGDTKYELRISYSANSHTLKSAIIERYKTARVLTPTLNNVEFVYSQSYSNSLAIYLHSMHTEKIDDARIAHQVTK
jgi:hypothetical protein